MDSQLQGDAWGLGVFSFVGSYEELWIQLLLKETSVQLNLFFAKDNVEHALKA